MAGSKQAARSAKKRSTTAVCVTQETGRPKLNAYKRFTAINIPKSKEALGLKTRIFGIAAPDAALVHLYFRQKRREALEEYQACEAEGDKHGMGGVVFPPLFAGVPAAQLRHAWFHTIAQWNVYKAEHPDPRRGKRAKRRPHHAGQDSGLIDFGDEPLDAHLERQALAEYAGPIGDSEGWGMEPIESRAPKRRSATRQSIESVVPFDAADDDAWLFHAGT